MHGQKVRIQQRKEVGAACLMCTYFEREMTSSSTVDCS